MELRWAGEVIKPSPPVTAINRVGAGGSAPPTCRIVHLCRMHADTAAYNSHLAPEDRAICEILAREIDHHLPEAENKIWHRHPVWFLAGNPIVGYHKLKDCVRLLFWSGRSFNEPGLKKEGKFQAAEVRYGRAAQVDTEQLATWLRKAREIQWDYKNIVKRRGVLERLK